MSHYESRSVPEVLRGIERNLEDENYQSYLERIAVALEKIAEQGELTTQSLVSKQAVFNQIPGHDRPASSRNDLSLATGLCLADPADQGIREHTSVCILIRGHGGTEHKDNSGGLWLV